MPELIDKEKLLRDLCGMCCAGDKYKCRYPCGECDAVMCIRKQPTIEPEVLLIPKEVSATDIDKLTEMIKGSLLQAYPNDVMFTAVRHGRWIPTEYDSYADGAPVWDKWECSECGHEHSGEEDTLTAFCPNCGARMDADETAERRAAADDYAEY